MGTGHFTLFLFNWLNLFFNQFLIYIPSTLHGLQYMHAKLLQSCPTLFDSMNCSPPGSSVHGILQARILEWVVMPFSRGDLPRDQTHISYVSCIGRWILYQHHLGCPMAYGRWSISFEKINQTNITTLCIYDKTQKGLTKSLQGDQTSQS